MIIVTTKLMLSKISPETTKCKTPKTRHSSAGWNPVKVHSAVNIFKVMMSISTINLNRNFIILATTVNMLLAWIPPCRARWLLHKPAVSQA